MGRCQAPWGYTCPATHHFRHRLSGMARRTGSILLTGRTTVLTVRNGQANGVHTPHWPDHSHDCPEWIRRTGSIPLTDRTTVEPDLKGCLEEVSKIMQPGLGPGCSDTILGGNQKVHGPGTGSRTSPDPKIFRAQPSRKKGRHEKLTLGYLTLKSSAKGPEYKPFRAPQIQEGNSPHPARHDSIHSRRA